MQFLVETDILNDYLTHTGSEASVLRRALSRGVCYTTMLNAMEVFESVATPQSREAVMNMLSVVRVLGFHPRYAESFAELGRRNPTLQQRGTLVAGMAVVSKLTILSGEHYTLYASVADVQVIRDAEEVPAGKE